MTKIILHGCDGKMGREVTELADNENIRIVAGIDKKVHEQEKYPVYEKISYCDLDADVVIDFSNASAIDDLLCYCVEHQIPIVICTTGLSEQQLKKIEEASKKIAILHAANMSLGINLLRQVLKESAKSLVLAGFDIELIEKHHNQKLDAPSGTALELAHAINESLVEPYDYIYDRSQKKEERKKEEIGISSVRGGTIVGEHEVIFAGEDEVMVMKHIAYSRRVFAKGAMEAAKFLKSKKAGMYDMSQVCLLKK